MTTQATWDMVKKAISELPTDSVGDAARMAYAVLEDNTLVPSRKVPDRLAQVINILEAIRVALQNDADVSQDLVAYHLRTRLGLPAELPPFDLEAHSEWVGIARDYYEYASADALPGLAKDLYEQYKGVEPRTQWSDR